MANCCYYGDTFTSDLRWAGLVFGSALIIALLGLFVRAAWLDRTRPGWRGAPRLGKCRRCGWSGMLYPRFCDECVTDLGRR